MLLYGIAGNIIIFLLLFNLIHMSYTKGMLERYAAQIEDPSRQAEFNGIVASVEFEDVNGRPTCSNGALQEAFVGTEVVDLCADFEKRFIHFLDPVSDLGHETTLPRRTVKFTSLKEGKLRMEINISEINFRLIRLPSMDRFDFTGPDENMVLTAEIDTAEVEIEKVKAELKLMGFEICE